MKMNYLLLLFPIVAHARINIKIFASTFNNKANVEVAGRDESVISDKEREIFNLSDEQVKSAVTKYFGARPSDIYLKSPTPWNDLYLSYGWPQVTRILYPEKATIIGINTKPVTFGTQEFTNNSPSELKYYIGKIQSQGKVSNSWRKKEEFTVGKDIFYDIEYADDVAGAKALNFTAQWGEMYTKPQAFSTDKGPWVEVVVQPGKVAQAIRNATKATMDIEIEYVAKIKGAVACNYPKRYIGHHFWGLDVNKLLLVENFPKQIVLREIITMVFYSKTKVNVISN